MDWKVTLSEPCLGEEEVKAVTEVLRSGWLTMGPRTAEFEREFASKLGCEHAIAVASCTAALHLAYLSLGLGKGDEVICPDLTFVATTNAVRYTGAEVVLVGARSASDLTLCPDQVAAAVTSRTRAICVVHYAGYACDMQRILDVASTHGLAVIEDCAHAPFARAELGGPQLGTLGQLGCFSFFGNKNMTTGEGGMVTTNDAALAARVRLLRAHGMSASTYDRDRGKAMGYDVVDLGFNYRFDEIRAALGLCQLARVDGLNARRRELVARYRERLADGQAVLVPFRDRDLQIATPHIMPVLVDGDTSAVRSSLKAEGIQTSKHYEPVGSFTAYGSRNDSPSQDLAMRIITLPLGGSMSDADVDLVAGCVTRATGGEP